MSEHEEKIIKEMIVFVENEEKDIQAAKLGKGTKNKAVNDILKELERQMKDAD